MRNIAVVVPTNRPEQYEAFLKAWQTLFDKHDVEMVKVVDGDDPEVIHIAKDGMKNIASTEGIPRKLVGNHSAAIRNYGFAYVAKFLPHVEYIITLDDDEVPYGDTIQDHLDALNQRVPISWFPTTIVREPTDYMRGFPYAVREEAEVAVSHGVWLKNPDFDAPSQLFSKNQPEYYRGAIPKGVFFPFCGMNVAFKRKVLPHVFYAPVGQFKGAERFDDIWGGLELKKDMDAQGLAIVTGYAQTIHTRASDVFQNLEREAVGIRKNEGYWKGDADEWYADFLRKRAEWHDSCR